MRRLGRLETAAIVGAEEVVSLLDALDVQAGYLRMIELALAGRPEDQELAQGALRAGARLREGLTRLLGSVREGIPDLVRLDLNQLLPSMIPALAREVGEGGRLRIAPTSTALPVDVNAHLMEHTLVHLVQNAREASGSDESVRVSWGPTFQSRPDGATWEGARIRVEDRGHGIARNDMPWIFEPFFSTRAEAHPLRGLGLSLVQAIVEGHGGWVEVQSRRGEGTEVDLYLPLASTAKEKAANEQGVPEAGALAGARVVLLEDEAMLAGLVARILTRGGHRVTVCVTPLEVERHLREVRGGVDLIVVARSLAGGRSGRQLAEIWQSRRPNLPVILLDRRSLLDATPPGKPEESQGIPVISPPFDPDAIWRAVAVAVGGDVHPTAPPFAAPHVH